MAESLSTEQGSNQQITDMPPLNQLYVYLTDGCNLACRHCWLAPKFDKTGKEARFLSKEIFAAIIDEALPLGLRTVKLTGGEPLLHPDIKELIRIVSENGLRLNVETNGMLCDADIAKEIERVSQKFVAVSIDGTEAVTHDRVRGVPGAFEKACAAVRNLSAAGITTQVIMTLMTANVDQVHMMISLAEQLGAESVKFNVLQPTARGLTLYDDGQAMSIKDVIELGHRVEQELAAATNLRLVFDFPLAFRSLKCMFSGDGCAACSIFSILGVLADGHYALCGIGAHVPELVFGWAGRDRLADVWQNNETLKAIRRGLPDRLEGVCSRCLMKGACLGACLAQNYYRHKNLWGGHWFCEMADEAGLFPESRLMPEK